MKNSNILLKATFVLSLCLGGVMVGSGTLLLCSYLTNKETVFTNKIEISNFDQVSSVSLVEADMPTGSEKNYEFEVKSNLVETVKYSIGFENHTLAKEDKYFYVSITNEQGELLMNNTLYEIFDKPLAVSNRKLGSFEKEKIIVSFSVSSALQYYVAYDFNLVVKAEGRLLN